MTEKKTLKQRREESDERIIQSSIKYFGEKGYTHCSLKEIAAGAGVTGGLITQRFSTKENLFVFTYIHVIRTYFSDVDINSTPRECLESLIHQIKDLKEKDLSAFKFCCMIYRSKDIPDDKVAEYIKSLKKTNLAKILRIAQAKGCLPEGELGLLLRAFCANAFLHILLCMEYGIVVPEDGYYLKAINFVDKEYEEKKTWKQVITNVVYNAFEFLGYVNLLGNNGIMLNCSEHSSLGDTDDIKSTFQNFIKIYIKDEEKQRMQEYLDLDTLDKRMKGHKELSCSFTDKEDNTYRFLFFPITWDKDGNLKEVLSAIYKIL